jgi:hypothetical protein
MDKRTEHLKVQNMSVIYGCKSSTYERKVICLTPGGLWSLGKRINQGRCT